MGGGRGKDGTLIMPPDLSGDESAANVRVEIVALIDIHPSNRDWWLPCLCPCPLDRYQTPNPLRLKIGQLLAPCFAHKLRRQRLSGEVVKVALFRAFGAGPSKVENGTAATVKTQNVAGCLFIKQHIRA